MIFFYIRHGEPVYSPDSLTPLGVKQAKALAKRLAFYGLDTIYSSTSNRAILTAKPTADLLKKEIIPLDFSSEKYAAEYFMGEFPNGGVSWCYQNDYLRNIFVSKEMYALGENWFDHPKFKNYKFKEGYLKLKKQSDDFLLSLGFFHNKDGTYTVVKPNNQRVALFAHEGFGKVFLSNLLDIPYPMLSTHYSLNHTGMSVIEFDETKEKVIPKILTLSNDSHLYKEGLPTTFNNYIDF